MKSPKYILTVFNTMTRRNEEIEVDEEVYRVFRRTGWNIRDNDQSFFDHEIQMSGMIGGQEGAYENFREFVDTQDVPENIVLKTLKNQALYHAVLALPKTDRRLVRALFYEGKTEQEYAKELGVSQQAVHKRKARVLRELKKFLKNSF